MPLLLMVRELPLVVNRIQGDGYVLGAQAQLAVQQRAGDRRARGGLVHG